MRPHTAPVLRFQRLHAWPSPNPSHALILISGPSYIAFHQRAPLLDPALKPTLEAALAPATPTYISSLPPS